MEELKRIIDDSEVMHEDDALWPPPDRVGRQVLRLFFYHGVSAMGRPLVKSAYQKINFLISQPKHMLWVLKRTVSMRRFF